MDNFFARDERITDPAMRDLEKKIHYILGVLSGNELITNREGNTQDLPDEICQDCNEVAVDLGKIRS